MDHLRISDHHHPVRAHAEYWPVRRECYYRASSEETMMVMVTSSPGGTQPIDRQHYVPESSPAA